MSSEGTSVIDFLSFSPLLIDILSYLKYTDIENARLVNKRMNDVIQKNGSHLDRPTVELELEVPEERATYSDVTYVAYHEKDVNMEELKQDRLCEFCISEDRIRLMDYPPAMEAYLLEKVCVLQDDSHCVEGEELQLRSEQCNKYRDFGISSMEQGLQLILRLLFRRFYLKVFTFRHTKSKQAGSQSPLLEIVIEEFKNSFSKCETLKIGSEHLGLARLHKTLGSGIYVDLRSSNIEDFLPQLHFDRNVNIMAKVERTTNSLSCFAQLLKKWSSGSLSLKSLTVTSHPAFPFSNHQLLTQLRCLHLVHAKNTDINESRTPLELLIKRRSDDKYLLIHYRLLWHLKFEEYGEPVTSFPDTPDDDV